MEITTKFDIGQLVWYIYGDKIHTGPVYKITLLLFRGSQTETYGISLGAGIIDRQPHSLFASKELLIESIV